MRCSECDMKRESVSDMLSRLSMLGSGEREAGLSGDDRDAILWAVDEIETAQKKSEEAEPSASDNTRMDKITLCLKQWRDNQGLYAIDDVIISQLADKLAGIA